MGVVLGEVCDGGVGMRVWGAMGVLDGGVWVAVVGFWAGVVGLGCQSQAWRREGRPMMGR